MKCSGRYGAVNNEERELSGESSLSCCACCGKGRGAYPFFRRVKMFCPSRYSYSISSISCFAM